MAIAPILNLFIALMPILILLSAFTQIVTVPASLKQTEKSEDHNKNFVLRIEAKRFIIASGPTSTTEKSFSKAIVRNGSPDNLQTLTRELLEIKRSNPQAGILTIESEEDIAFGLLLDILEAVHTTRLVETDPASTQVAIFEEVLLSQD